MLACTRVGRTVGEMVWDREDGVDAVAAVEGDGVFVGLGVAYAWRSAKRTSPIA